MKVPHIGVRGKTPVGGLGTSLQKMVIFCKLYYNDVIRKKAKQYLST